MSPDIKDFNISHPITLLHKKSMARARCTAVIECTATYFPLRILVKSFLYSVRSIQPMWGLGLSVEKEKVRITPNPQPNMS